MTSISNSITHNDVVVQSEARLRDYFELLKPRVMSLVVFTGFAGMWVAPGMAETHPFLLLIGMLALALGAGAAGAINMWYDRDIDIIMTRTKDRPIPKGCINPDEALGFGVILSVFAVMIMGLALNWVAAALLACANLFYVFIYTIWLKRTTPQNIVIGGAAGAFPPMIGWAMVTGDIGIMPAILFGIIFLWTPPHFWALSLFANEDYRRAEIPMMTVTHGARHTKWQMIAYTVLLLPLTLLPSFLGYASVNFGIAAFILSGFFIITAIRVFHQNDLKFARQMFAYSVFYLFALFGALMLL